MIGLQICLSIVSANSFSPTVRHSDPTVAAIVQKADATYGKMQTYQAVYKIDMSGTNAGWARLQVAVKTVPKKKLSYSISPIATGSGTLGRDAQLGRLRLVDDGEVSYVAMPGYKQWSKGPHSAGFGPSLWPYGVFIGSSVLHQLRGMTYEGELKFGHSRAYMVRGLGQKSDIIDLFINKRSFRIVGARYRVAQNGQAIEIVSRVISEKVNGPMPDWAFKFSPPAGFSEVNSGAGD